MGDKFDKCWKDAGVQGIRQHYAVGDRLLIAHIDQSHLGVAVVNAETGQRTDITTYVAAACDSTLDRKLILNPNLIDILNRIADIIPLPTDIDRVWYEDGKLVTYKGGIKEFWK